jgi:hypothetical protein
MGVANMRKRNPRTRDEKTLRLGGGEERGGKGGLGGRGKTRSELEKEERRLDVSERGIDD